MKIPTGILQQQVNLGAGGEETLIDSYSESKKNGYSQVNIPSYGQTFSCGIDADISKAKFYLERVGGDETDAWIAELYAITGNYGVWAYPVGSPLAVSDPIDNYDIPSSGYNLVDFLFTGAEQYSMVSGQKYAIVITRNGSSVCNLARDGLSPTHSGNYVYYENGSWTGASTRDYPFYVYGLV